jgi:uncharacterized protein YndB with AHSA1/START domain
VRTTKVEAPAGMPFIDITREFDAPRALLFRAHTEPDLLIQWLGPARYEMTIDRWEARDGGRYRYVHRGPDGVDLGFRGVFHGDPSPSLMVQTFEFEGAPGSVALNELTMEEHDGATTVRIHSVYQSVASRDAMLAGGAAAGMQEGFGRLERLLARLAAPVV